MVIEPPWFSSRFIIIIVVIIIVIVIITKVVRLCGIVFFSPFFIREGRNSLRLVSLSACIYFVMIHVTE